MSVGDWIPVTERLPDDEIEVLISTMHESFPVWIGYVSHEHDETRWHWDSGRVVPEITPVTAWMPLPEPHQQQD